MSRCVVLIDGAYLGAFLKELGEPRVNVAKLAKKLALQGEVIRTYYYHCMPYQSDPPTEGERRRTAAMQRFIHTLQESPRFEVRLGKLKKVRDEHGRDAFVQKRVDVLQAVDLVRMSWDGQIEYAYLLTGDSDLVPAIQTAKEAGVVVALYYREGSAMDELLQTVDEAYPMTPNFFDDCLL